MSNPPEWWFYHLERSTLEQAAGPLLEKCIEKGWRVLPVSADASRRKTQAGRQVLARACWIAGSRTMMRGGVGA